MKTQPVEWIFEDLRNAKLQKVYAYANRCLMLQQIDEWFDMYPLEEDKERLQDLYDLAIAEAKALKELLDEKDKNRGSG